MRNEWGARFTLVALFRHFEVSHASFRISSLGPLIINYESLRR